MSAAGPPLARRHLSARPRAALAATYVVIACAAAYGGMKLGWALGGDLLKAQTPLPRDAQQALLVDDNATAVASHWITVVLAATGAVVAWIIGTDRAGRQTGRLLRAGAWAVGMLMVVRAVGGFGFGFVGDALVLGHVSSVVDPRYAEHAAHWDVFLWSPFWLLFGLAWGVLAYRTKTS